MYLAQWRAPDAAGKRLLVAEKSQMWVLIPLMVVCCIGGTCPLYSYTKVGFECSLVRVIVEAAHQRLYTIDLS